MTSRSIGGVLGIFLVALLFSPQAWAKTLNGNVFALYYSEAKTDQGRGEVLGEAKGNPHYFRYLQIMEMEEGNTSRGPYVEITAFEPSSYMDVKFKVTKRVSLSKLVEEPVSKKGDAIAITGIVSGVEDNTIILGPVIVRHKDRLDPKRGKEMLYEVDETARFYSFTAGKRPVSLSYRDRDLLQYKDEVLKKYGDDGWVEFLEKELAKRKKTRQASKKAREAEWKAQVREKAAGESQP